MSRVDLKNRWQPPVWLVLMLCCAGSSCVTYERAALLEQQRFDLLYSRKLVQFEQRLASENQGGVDDDWTRLGEAWVKLLNCQAIDPYALMPEDDGDVSAVDPVVELLHATLVLEERRRKRLVHHRATKFVPRSISGTIFDPIDDKDYFVRNVSATVAESAVVWPKASEAWADELPGYLPQNPECESLYRALYKAGRKERAAYDAIQKTWKKSRGLPNIDVINSPPPRHRLLPSVEQLQLWRDAAYPQEDESTKLVDESTEEKTSSSVQQTEEQVKTRGLLVGEDLNAEDPTTTLPETGTLASLYLAEIIQAEHVLAVGEALPEHVRSLPSIHALLWRVRFHLVFMAGEHIRQLSVVSRPSPREAELRQAWVMKRREWALPLAQQELEPGASLEVSEQILSNWRIAPLLEYALFAEEERRFEDALRAYERIHAIGVSERNIWSARYLHLRLLGKLGKWEDMEPYMEELPPQQSRLYTPYLWHVSRALFATGQYERFLAVAMESMRDRPYQSDPFMKAVYLKMLATLTERPFESRTVELLEDMGPRSSTFDRVEAYAAVSLDRGKTENARAAAKWLLGKHLNANYRPRYHAILALAAFLEDDLTAFSASLDEVVARPADLVEAVGVGRRGSFFVNADEQLARVFREMLPVMAEWGDGAQAKALRQKWLKVITLRAQSFLQNSPESLARPALVELYRIASSMLEDDEPRAYPERVGAVDPAPLVLGTVRVGERELDAFEPGIRTYHEQVPSLTLVPRDDVPTGEWIEWFEPTARDVVEEGSEVVEVSR